MINLKLDLQALNALFPEGSQARLDLQAGVIANVVNHVVGRKVSTEISDRISAEVEKYMSQIDVGHMVRTEFKQYVEKRWGYSNILDSNPAGIRDLAAKVKESVTYECSDILDKIRRDAQTQAKEQLLNNESEFIGDITKNLTSVVRKEVVKQVNNEFPEIIRDAINTKLFPEGFTKP